MADNEVVIDVAAGALINARGEVLLAQRPQGKHMAGYWEFPGGKFEAQETALDALIRELQEELGIGVTASEPLITLTHRYPDRVVRLHVWRVTAWKGVPQSLDQQALRWVLPADMSAWELLPADGPIVNALCLPGFYPISPNFSVSAVASWPNVETWLQRLRAHRYSLFQWRQKGTAADDEYLAQRVAEWASENEMAALLNGHSDDGILERAARLGFAGVHLPAAALLGAPVGAKQKVSDLGLRWLAASCHNKHELTTAKELELDFAVLGAVRKTPTHPDGVALGEAKFEQLAVDAGLPVYAIGGCGVDDDSNFRARGAQGVAGIRAFLV